MDGFTQGNAESRRTTASLENAEAFTIKAYVVVGRVRPTSDNRGIITQIGSRRTTMRAFLLAACLAYSPACFAGTALYVATSGNDAWSGRLAEPNPRKTDGPLTTLDGCRDEIRAMKKAAALPPGGVTVFVRAGRFGLQKAFHLAAEDSGTEASPIVDRAIRVKRRSSAAAERSRAFNRTAARSSRPTSPHRAFKGSTSASSIMAASGSNSHASELRPGQSAWRRLRLRGRPAGEHVHELAQRRQASHSLQGVRRGLHGIVWKMRR